MNKQFYKYAHTRTHIYRTFLSKKEDDKDNMQTYCRVKDTSCTNLAKIMLEGSGEEQRELGDRPRASWKTFLSLQKYRQKIRLPRKDTEFIWIQFI